MRSIFLLFLLGGTLLSSCGESLPPCRAPVLKERNTDLSSLMIIDERSQMLVGSAIWSPGHGGDEPLGFIFQGLKDSQVSVSLDPEGEALLAIYGPRDQKGLYGEAIAQSAGCGTSVSLDGVRLSLEGSYLLLIQPRSGTSLGAFHLSLRCEEGCDHPPDPCSGSLDACFIYCEGGFKLNERGCPMCECNRPQCEADLDCLPGESCRNGLCVEGCVCRDGYDPVCGADGNTYANQCEAVCYRVEIVSSGPCGDPECVFDTECGLNQRCEEGACVEGCPCYDQELGPVCVDGITFDSPCAALCAGHQEYTMGECSCPPFECDILCPQGYGNDAMGCPVCRCIDDHGCSSTAGCQEGYSCVHGRCWAEDCPYNCPALDRVCATDGLTYRNLCEVLCVQGTEPLHRGPCHPLPACDPLGDGSDCPDSCLCMADQQGESLGVCLIQEGSSPLGHHQECPDIYDPVCTSEGKEYHTLCDAALSSRSVIRYGSCCPPLEPECRQGCESDLYYLDQTGCPTCDCILDPLAATVETLAQGCTESIAICCGDGIIYSNQCVALKAGAQEITPGLCPD